jgi:hypothetical protein
MEMGTYEGIRTARRLVVIGAWSGAGLALAYLAVAIAEAESAPGAIWTLFPLSVLLATPSVWALLSLDRRPALLPAAAMAAVVVAVIELLLFFFLPVHLIPAILFSTAVRRRPRPESARPPWKRPLMAAALVLPLLGLISHLDPVCTTVAADGSVVQQANDGAPTGWRFQVLSMAFSTSSVAVPGEERTTCFSDSTVWWEGLSSLVLAVAVVLPGLRWPPSEGGSSEVRREPVLVVPPERGAPA